MTDIRMTQKDRLELKRRLPGSPDQVWAYLVEDEKRRKWFCGGDIEPRVGGVAVFEFDHSRITDAPPPEDHGELVMRRESEVLIYDKPRELSFMWFEEETPSRVTIRLTAVEGGVELHLIHEQLTETSGPSSLAGGWGAHFDLLDDILSGQKRYEFWARYGELEARYAAEFAN